jgi:hypothetical protein
LSTSRRRTFFLDEDRGLCGEDFAPRRNREGVPISSDARGWVRGLFGLELARGLVRFVSQLEEQVEEVLRLADEEPVIHETLKGGDSAPELSGRRANDGDRTQAWVDEMGWLGHDQVSLQRIAVEGLGIRLALGSRERRERYCCARAARSVVRVGNRKSIAGFVLPRLEVHGLARTDAEQDSQNLEVRYLLRQRGIEAAAALFDKCKVKSGSEGDGLEVSADALRVVVGDRAVSRVRVGPGNRRVLLHVQARDSLHERRARIEIGIRDAAVA